jgi:hypothetical protein
MTILSTAIVTAVITAIGLWNSQADPLPCSHATGGNPMFRAALLRAVDESKKPPGERAFRITRRRSDLRQQHKTQ